MITLSKLKIYERYGGDVDMFGRAGRGAERLLVSEDEWHLIGTLVQDATVINRKLGSEDRTAEAVERLRENCENEEVVAQIRRLAEKI